MFAILFLQVLVQFVVLDLCTRLFTTPFVNKICLKQNSALKLTISLALQQKYDTIIHAK